MRFPKPTRKKDKAYIEWIKSLRCCVTGKPDPDPHHCNESGCGGMGSKSSDRRTIPLSHALHAELHQHGSQTFSSKYELDYEVIIKELNMRYDKYKKNSGLQ